MASRETLVRYASDLFSVVLSAVFFFYVIQKLPTTTPAVFLFLNTFLLGLVLVFFLYPLLLEIYRLRFKLPDRPFALAAMVWIMSLFGFFICLSLFTRQL